MDAGGAVADVRVNVMVARTHAPILAGPVVLAPARGGVIRHVEAYVRALVKKTAATNVAVAKESVGVDVFQLVMRVAPVHVVIHAQVNVKIVVRGPVQVVAAVLVAKAAALALELSLVVQPTVVPSSIFDYEFSCFLTAKRTVLLVDRFIDKD